jgi:hypothetical protein
MAEASSGSTTAATSSAAQYVTRRRSVGVLFILYTVRSVALGAHATGGYLSAFHRVIGW